MKLDRPPFESQPRPHKAVDVLQAVETEPESGLIFDPHVDISKESETGMFNRLNECRNKNWLEFSGIAMHLSVLYPNRKADLKLGEVEFNGMKAKLNEFRNNNYLWDFSNMAMHISILYPDRKADLELGESEFNGMKAKLDELKKHRVKDWFNFSDMAMRLSILYPDRKADFQLGESEFNGMKVKLDEYRNNNNYLWYFSNMAVHLSILYPDRKADLQLGESEFNGMEAKLDEHRRNKDWWLFSRMAMRLTILSADSVQITADGQIRLTHKKKNLIKKPKLLPIALRV